MFLLGTSALLTLYSTQPILSPLSKHFAVSISSATLTVSATTFGVALFAPVAGSIADHVGRRPTIIWAIVALIAATLVCLTAPGFPVLLLGRFLEGVATPFIFAPAVADIGGEFATGPSIRLNSIYVAGTAFGGFAGRFLSGVFFDVFGSWRWTFAPLLGMLLLVLGSALAWLPVERRFTPTPSPWSGLAGIGRHLRDWRIVATCVVGASLLFQQVATFTFGSLHLQKPPLNLTTMQVGLMFAVFLVPTLVTSWFGRLIGSIGRAGTFAISTVLGLVGLALTLIPHVGAIIIGLTCSCVAVFAGQACATGFVGQHARRDASAAVGLYLTSYYLGGTLGGIVPSAPYAAFGWVGVIGLVTVVAVVALGAAVAAWKKPA